MSDMQQVPAPFVQEYNEQGEIVDVKPVVWEGPTLYMWLRMNNPELFRQIFGEPKAFSEQPATNWPPMY